MTQLETHLTLHPTPDALARLQLAGVVSDNCLTVEDVAEADCERAVKFLEAASE